VWMIYTGVAVGGQVAGATGPPALDEKTT